MVRRILFFFFLLLADVVGVLFAVLLASLLRSLFGHWFVPWPKLWILIVILALFVIGIGLYRGLYVRRLPFWLEVKECWIAVSFSAILTYAFMLIGGLWYVSRLFLFLVWFSLLFTVPVIRIFVKKILYSLNIYRDNLLILGANPVGLRAGEYILRESTMGYNLVGFLDDQKVGGTVEIMGKEVRVLGRIKRVKRIVKVYSIDTVMVALPEMVGADLVDLVNKIHSTLRKVLFVPDIKGIALLNSEIIPPFMDDIMLVQLKNNLMYTRNAILKRSFDLISSLFITAVLSPIFLTISLLIKMTSPGPIFYRQKRIGKGGREFWVYKFRTMFPDADKRLKLLLESDPTARREWEERRKLKRDPRITSIGRFLRRFSLDELPQLINVIRGEMSLVGPRPVTQEEIKKYYGENAYYYYLVRPGITGLWQVSGRSDTDYRFRVETDVWYVLNWTLWLDLMILIKTFWVVVRGKGAY